MLLRPIPANRQVRRPRRTRASRAICTCALGLTLAPVTGCNDSIRSTFRQTAATHVGDTIDLVLNNFFTGVSDILTDNVQLPSSPTEAAADTATDTETETAQEGRTR